MLVLVLLVLRNRCWLSELFYLFDLVLVDYLVHINIVRLAEARHWPCRTGRWTVGGIPLSRLAPGCLWRRRTPPRQLGPVRPPPRGSGSQRAATADADEPGPAPRPPLMPIRLRPIVQGHPPPTGRYFGDHGPVRTTWTPLRRRASPHRLAPPSVAGMA